MATQLERQNPKTKELAKKLGQKIYYRGGAYWVSCQQLTYDSETIDGKPVTCTHERKLKIAEEILERLLKAKEKQESMNVEDRVNEIIKGMKDISMLPKCFCTFGLEFLDHGTLFRAYSTLNGWLRITGFQEIKIEDSNLPQDELCDALKEQFIKITKEEE